MAAGASRLSIFDADPVQAMHLVGRLRRRWPNLAHMVSAPDPRVDVAINATPLGMRPDDPLPLSPTELPAGCLVADIVMEPAETRLLREATDLGLPIQPGLPMLTHQWDCYREFFDLT